jgi:inner membrane protein
MMLGKRLGNRALAWGALFGILPDLDAFLLPFLHTANQLRWHRGPSHSLLVMIAASFLLAPQLAKLWKRDKIRKPLAGAFVFTLWGSHLLIDASTVYGTSLLWPFSPNRVSFNHLFIVDFFFTMPMLVTLVWLAFLRTKKQAPKRRRLNAWGLGLATSYALLSIAMKCVASRGFEADLARRAVTYQRRMEAPTPSNILLWRAVVERSDSFWVGYRSVFESRTSPVRWTVYPKDIQTLASVTHLPEIQTLQWFTNRWWIARPHAKGVWIGDLRFDETKSWGEKKGVVDNRLVFSWNISETPQHDRLQTLAHVRKNTAETLGRITARIIGNHEAWEANPRLAGVTGSLPEFLAVEE